MRKWRSSDVREELERAVSFEPDDGKVPTVSCEHGADVFPFGEVGHGGIGKLQASGFVAFHRGRDGGQIVGSER
jgi:hypothetical protein